MNQVRELMYADMKKNARRFKIILMIIPFLKNKFKAFANHLNTFAEKGIPALNNTPCLLSLLRKSVSYLSRISQWHMPLKICG